jgi:hypothetical protein
MSIKCYDDSDDPYIQFYCDGEQSLWLEREGLGVFEVQDPVSLAAFEDDSCSDFTHHRGTEESFARFKQWYKRRFYDEEDN